MPQTSTLFLLGSLLQITTVHALKCSQDHGMSPECAAGQLCTGPNNTDSCGAGTGQDCSRTIDCGYNHECEAFQDDSGRSPICVRVGPGPDTKAPITEVPAPTNITQTPAPTNITQTPAPTDSNKCEPSVDNGDYCKCTPPVTLPSGEIEISVCGDATFLIPKGSIPCSGTTLQEGAICPSKDATTTIACKDRDIMSFLNGGKTGTCKAPANAECKLLNTGAFGCIFPGNANTVNACLDVLPVSKDYQVDASGKVMVGDNGYPVPTKEALQSGNVTDTGSFPSPVTLSADSGASEASVYALTTTSLFAIVLLATL